MGLYDDFFQYNRISPLAQLGQTATDPAHYEAMKRQMIQQLFQQIGNDDSIAAAQREKERQAKFDALPSATQFGELVGWRSWKISVTPEGPRLKSSYKDTVWPSGIVTGKDGAGNSAQVNSIRHDAGWFAYKTASQLMQESEKEDVRVGGKVELWGAVVEHEMGYRAECMKILTLEAIGPRAALVIDELREFYLKGN